MGSDWGVVQNLWKVFDLRAEPCTAIGDTWGHNHRQSKPVVVSGKVCLCSFTPGLRTKHVQRQVRKGYMRAVLSACSCPAHTHTPQTRGSSVGATGASVASAGLYFTCTITHRHLQDRLPFLPGWLGWKSGSRQKRSLHAAYSAREGRTCIQRVVPRSKKTDTPTQWRQPALLHAGTNPAPKHSLTPAAATHASRCQSGRG
jgi:hypothetical protein